MSVSHAQDYDQTRMAAADSAEKERDALKYDEARNKKIQNFLRNFQMQAHGAEMLRLACIYPAEKGLAICAPLPRRHLRRCRDGGRAVGGCG
jgi:hypothetical protein